MPVRSNPEWDDIKSKLWAVFKPALIAMIVALLVTLGVARPGGVQVQGVSHFSSVYSNDDVQAVDDLIAGDDVTVTDDITLSGALVAVESVSAADLVASDDVTTGDDVTVGDDLIVTDASNLHGSISSGTGAVTVTDSVLIDGQTAAAQQFRVQGAGSQTGNLLVLESSDGTDVLTGTVTGDLYATGNVSIEDYVRVIQESALTVCEGCPITSTATYMQITAAGAVTTSTTTAVVSGTYTGEVLWLVNVGAQNIIVDDGGNTDLGGSNITLGGTDVLALIWNGTDWLRLWNTDN
jgi:cytoskeletal protein CcmA (bactofilin family)